MHDFEVKPLANCKELIPHRRPCEAVYEDIKRVCTEICEVNHVERVIKIGVFFYDLFDPLNNRFHLFPACFVRYAEIELYPPFFHPGEVYNVGSDEPAVRNGHERLIKPAYPCGSEPHILNSSLHISNPDPVADVKRPVGEDRDRSEDVAYSLLRCQSECKPADAETRQK